MSRQVWKIPLSFDSATRVALSTCAVVRHVAVQDRRICLWIEVDARENIAKCERVFTIFGTGHELPEGAEYCGTVMLEPFVWHVYELAAV